MELSEQTYEKYRTLCRYFAEKKRVAVAFSGGVDSTLLLKAAHETLGEHAIAVLVDSPFFPRQELAEAAGFCESEGIELVVLHLDMCGEKTVADNPPDRCYHCKKLMFEMIGKTAEEYRMQCVVEGSNTDDMGDYRPGMAAIRELSVESPLCAVGLGKEEIRSLSKRLSLPTAEKPSMACLASRIAYGEPITEDKLLRIEAAERLLSERGFGQSRVRMHGNLARVEIVSCDFPKLLDADMREDVHAAIKGLGFDYVSLDLLGYRTGSMNETL